MYPLQPTLALFRPLSSSFVLFRPLSFSLDHYYLGFSPEVQYTSSIQIAPAATGSLRFDPLLTSLVLFGPLWSSFVLFGSLQTPSRAYSNALDGRARRIPTRKAES